MSKELLINLRDYLIGTLSDEDKFWLANELSGEHFENPYTKEEINARFDEAERQYANGDYLPADEAIARIRKQLQHSKELELEAV